MSDTTEDVSETFMEFQDVLWKVKRLIEQKNLNPESEERVRELLELDGGSNLFNKARKCMSIMLNDLEPMEELEGESEEGIVEAILND